MPKTARLKALREKAVLTQAELATKAGIAKSTIVDLESGRVAGRPTTIRKLAAALGVEPGELVGD